MNTYIAFLRGINVSGQKKIKMADLRLELDKSGFENVHTYIQSGNLVFESPSLDRTGLEAKMKQTILDGFGFEVPVIIKTVDELTHILESNPFSKIAENKNQFFTMLHQMPTKELVSAFRELKFPNEDFYISEKCVYLNCKMGAGRAKLNNNLIEQKLKVTATTRNLNTMRKMVELGNP